MVVTGAFFCEAWTVSEGKLNALGAVWDWFVANVGDDADNPPLNLVILTQSPPEDEERLDLHIEVMSPSGEQVMQATGEGKMPRGTTSGFVIVPLPVPFRVAGRYSFIVKGSSGTPFATSLDVRAL